MITKKEIQLAPLMGITEEQCKEKLGITIYETWWNEDLIPELKAELAEKLKEVDQIEPKWEDLTSHQRMAIDNYGCCKAARRSKTPCVCMIYFECPIHGGTHVGTHD